MSRFYNFLIRSDRVILVYGLVILCATCRISRPALLPEGDGKTGQAIGLEFFPNADQPDRDITHELQEAMDGLSVYPRGFNQGKKSYSTVHLKRGKYFISETLILRGKIGFRIIGEDPQHTILEWRGKEKDTMLWADGSAYFKVSNLTFHGGFRTGMEGIGIHWATRASGGVNHFASLNIEINNCRFTGGMDVGVGGGSYASGDWTGANDSEVTIRYCEFDGCASAGIRIAGFNALDYWIWNCRFMNCVIGVDCRHGNYHVYNSYFRQSALADVHNTGGYYTSLRGCFSENSMAFSVDGGSSSNPFKRVFENNIVKQPKELPIQYHHIGKLSLYGNRIDRSQADTLNRKNPVRSPDPQMDPSPVSVTYGSWYPSIFTILSLRNKFFYAAPFRFSSAHPSMLYQADDKVGHTVSSEGLESFEKTGIQAVPVLKETVFRVPLNSTTDELQAIIQRASASGIENPVVQFEYGRYALNKSVFIPAHSRIKLRGEGLIYSSMLVIENPEIFKGEALFIVRGPTNVSIQDLHIVGNTTRGGSKLIGIDFRNVDTRNARVVMDQLYCPAETSVFVDRYNYTLFEKNNSFFSDGNIIIGGDEQKAGRGTLRFHAFGGQYAGTQVFNGARAVFKDCWYEGSRKIPLSLVGDGEILIDGAMCAPNKLDSTTTIAIEGFRGKVTLANMYMYGSILLKPSMDSKIFLWNINMNQVARPSLFAQETYPGQVAIAGITTDCNFPGELDCGGFKSYEDRFHNISDKNAFILSNMEPGMNVMPVEGLLPGDLNQISVSRVSMEGMGIGLKFSK